MRISCEGWKHIVKSHKLIQRDISAVKQSERQKAYYRDEVYIHKDDDGGLIINAGVENLKLNGNFAVEVRLTKAEIIHLASIALADEPLGEVVNSMSKTMRMAATG